MKLTETDKILVLCLVVLLLIIARMMWVYDEGADQVATGTETFTPVEPVFIESNAMDMVLLVDEVDESQKLPCAPAIALGIRYDPNDCIYE